MFKIISWDIGIKNLSYCLSEFNLNSNKLNIIEWNIIDIIKNYKCKYCKKNINKHKVKNININIKSDKCDKCDKCENYAKKSYCKYKFCLNHSNNIKNIKKKSNSNKINIFILKNLLIQSLELNKNLFTNINIVLIENQPALMNPTIKSISDTLYTWFLIRNNYDKSNDIKIILMNPSTKLSINNAEFDKLKIKYNLNEKKNRKLLSIHLCYFLFSKNILLTEYLNTFIKKDDICDCLLYIIRYINDNYKIDNIINLFSPYYSLS
jgi:hypothetical protein